MITVDRILDDETRSTISLEINGMNVICQDGATVLEAARNAGIYIPTLCHDPDLKPYGACRMCVVEIETMRGLLTSCTTPARNGMVVHTHSERVKRSRRITMELIIANHRGNCLTCYRNQDCALQRCANHVGVDPAHFDRLRKRAPLRPVDKSHPAFEFDPNKCILCAKCVRACHEIVGVGAIDVAFRGYDAKISSFGDQSWVESICQSCGNCIDRCPAGALVPKQEGKAAQWIRTICPYCGVGCSIRLGIRENKVVGVKADRTSPVNRGDLCVKGRYGLDFIHHSDRLMHPLIRKADVPKNSVLENPLEAFRKADWDEALNRISHGLGSIRTNFGPNALGVLSSAKCTNEDNYIVQKFARAVLGTNNVDHCARLCHSSTVIGAMAAFGSGAMSNSISDIDQADLLFVIGSNTTECHPIIGRRIKHAVKSNGAKLIVADPRFIELSELATVHLTQKPGTDVALLNGIMNQIVTDNRYDKGFVEDRCENFEPFQESLKAYSPQKMANITGVPVDRIRHAAALFEICERAIILYGMGITQHTTGTDNVLAVANLLMLTGNIGREGTGFSPLRGQNNVQGACDLGALPNVYPGYQAVGDPKVKAKFARAWGCDLDDQPGLALTEMFSAAHTGQLKAMYIMGENPMLSEPDLQHAREAMAKLDFLAVQDIFLTETAQMADVVLPASSFAEKDGTFTNTERRIQRVRKAIDPPGEARVDWKTIADIATRMGYPLFYESSADIMMEIASLTPIYGGITYDRLEENSGLQWPCLNIEHPGMPFLHKDRFTRGRGKFHEVHYKPPAELPSTDYPLVLTTGRILEHWHTGSMSHRSRVLEALAPESSVEISPPDAAKLGFHQGDVITLSSRRGKLQTKVKETSRVAPGMAFMAFHWQDAPANELTNPALDPVAKIPEFKVSSAKAILAVLDKAAADNEFFAALAEDPTKALSAFDLTPEQRAALAAGDITAIEKWVGPLEERLKVWLQARLEMERW